MGGGDLKGGGEGGGRLDPFETTNRAVRAAPRFVCHALKIRRGGIAPRAGREALSTRHQGLVGHRPGAIGIISVK